MGPPRADLGAMVAVVARGDHGAIATQPNPNAMNTLNAVHAFHAVFATKRLPHEPLPVLLRRCRLALFTPSRAASAASAVPEPSAEASPAEHQDDTPRACGWFDSSYELHHGLRVQEHLSADSLATELPLGAWLDLQLSGWRAAVPVATAPAFTHPT